MAKLCALGRQAAAAQVRRHRRGRLRRQLAAADRPQDGKAPRRHAVQQREPRCRWQPAHRRRKRRRRGHLEGDRGGRPEAVHVDQSVDVDAREVGHEAAQAVRACLAADPRHQHRCEADGGGQCPPPAHATSTHSGSHRRHARSRRRGRPHLGGRRRRHPTSRHDAPPDSRRPAAVRRRRAASCRAARRRRVCGRPAAATPDDSRPAAAVRCSTTVVDLALKANGV